MFEPGDSIPLHSQAEIEAKCVELSLVGFVSCIMLTSSARCLFRDEGDDAPAAGDKDSKKAKKKGGVHAN